MKKFLLLLPIISILTACGEYGSGSSVGYVYAVDDGGLWYDNVWFKSSLQASESDCYLVKDPKVKSDLESLMGEIQVKITYSRQIVTASLCPQKNETNDIITGVEKKTNE